MFTDCEDDEESATSNLTDEIVHSINCGRNKHDFSDLVDDCFYKQYLYFQQESPQETRKEDDNRNCKPSKE